MEKDSSSSEKHKISFDDIKIGNCYLRGDDALYKVVDKGCNWVLVLSYSYYHCVANPWIFNKKEIDEDNLYEETDIWAVSIFDELEYHDYDTLK